MEIKNLDVSGREEQIEDEDGDWSLDFWNSCEEDERIKGKVRGRWKTLP